MKIIHHVILVSCFLAFNCNAEVYKCENNGKLVFSDKSCGKNAEVTKYTNPKYISFQYGTSACKSRKSWEITIDKIEAGVGSPESLSELDNKCLWLNEKTPVFGYLEKVEYKKRQLVKVKASDGTTVW